MKPPKFIAKYKPAIFISYRRGDTSGQVGRLAERLKEEFGDDQVFTDIDSIPAGTDFDVAINEQLKKCNVFMAVIGKRWSVGDGSVNRFNDPDDFVRREIIAALDRNIVVIPLFVQGASFQLFNDLPPELVRFTKKQAQELTERNWPSDVERLIDTLEQKSTRVLSWPKLAVYLLALVFVIAGFLVMKRWILPGSKTSGLEKTDTITKKSKFEPIDSSGKDSETINKNTRVPEKPLLRVKGVPDYGYTTRTNGKVPLTIYFENTHDAIAKNLQVKVLALKEFQKGGFQLSPGPLKKWPDHSDFLSIEGVYKYIYEYNYTEEEADYLPDHNTYFYIAVSYTDELGLTQPILRDIYILLTSTHKLMLISGSNSNYDKIKQYLHSEDSW